MLNNIFQVIKESQTLPILHIPTNVSFLQQVLTFIIGVCLINKQELIMMVHYSYKFNATPLFHGHNRNKYANSPCKRYFTQMFFFSSWTVACVSFIVGCDSSFTTQTILSLAWLRYTEYHSHHWTGLVKVGLLPSNTT